MYAVIFRAEIKKLDASYMETAARLRDLATSKYGCREFITVSEGDQEIAISYWDSKDQIKAWKEDPDHRIAQEQGRKQWYRSYRVQVVQILREYANQP